MRVVLIALAILVIGIANSHAEERVALVIGNATYPEDSRPLAQPINDARALADELKRAGFDVTIGENLSKQQLRAAIDAFRAKIKSGSVALFFFSGYGMQTAKQSYVIPVDAQIWTEGEVRRDGTSLESILGGMNAAGATVKLVIIDAARRNPFDRRVRGYSAGLASLPSPAGTLAIYSTGTDKVADDPDGENSLFVRELLKEMHSPNLSAEAILKNTREGVSRASKNEQVPFVSSSLVEDFYFGRPPVTVAIAPDTGRQVARPAPPEARPALPPPPPVDPADRAWAALDKQSVPELDAFIARFKDGFYVEVARVMRDELKKVATAAPPVVSAAPAASPCGLGTSTVSGASGSARPLTAAEECAPKPKMHSRNATSAPTWSVNRRGRS